MLIEFKVTNYRSIRESQTFSMVASKDPIMQDSNCMPSGIPDLTLVRAAALYGPNASGKSNLILALAFMRSMIGSSATMNMSEGQKLNVAPFKLDKDMLNEPSEFEAIFVENGVRYQYGFALNSDRVVREWLSVYIKRKAQRWFERKYDFKKNKDIWYIGTNLPGGVQRQVWKNATRGNALFLSTAVNLNSEPLRPVFNWFVNKLVTIGGISPLDPGYTMQRIKEEADKTHIIQFLQAADLGITDVQIKAKKVNQVQLRFDADGSATQLGKREADAFAATLFHQGKNKESVGFDLLAEESHGTQRVFAYAGFMLDILQNGKVLVVDELESGLHPKIVCFLISLAQNSKLNKNNAQLFFTTHNTSLLQSNLLRRDQIWFMEKDQEQASKLYPLTDFSPRKEEALEKGYLLGRYGAVPFVDEFNL